MEANGDEAMEADGDATSGDGSESEGDGDESEATSNAEGESAGTSAGELCGDLIPGLTPVGEPCAQNEDCESWVCEEYQTFPTTPAVCGVVPDRCRTRAMGTIHDILTDAPIAGVEIDVIASAGVLDPQAATPIMDGMTDDMGRYDMLSDDKITDTLGFVGRMHVAGYQPGMTGVAGPIDDNGTFPPLTSVHDWWMVKQDDLSTWNAALAGDAAIADFLPLEENNVIYIIVRTHDIPSERLVGAKVVPVVPESSKLMARYLQEDGSFNDQATGPAGIALLFRPAAGEYITVETEGGELSNVTAARAGMTIGRVVWTMPLDVRFE